MNYLILICFVISSFVCGQEMIDLSIQVENLKSQNGHIRVAVFDKNDKFLTESKYTCIKEISQSTICDFKIPKGKYAIAVIHDENKNAILDTNKFGIPIEAYGFSNQMRPRFSQPRFKDAVMNLTESINLKIRVKTWI